MSPFNDVSVHIMSAPLHCYTNKPGSEFGNSGVTVKLKWCHNVMVEAEDHLWLLLTSILDIYSVMAPFNDVSVHIMNAPLLCYTTKARSDFGNSGVTAEWKWCHDSWLRLQTTFNCFSHPYWKYIVCFGTFQWCQCVYYEWTLTLTTLLYQQTWINFG